MQFVFDYITQATEYLMFKSALVNGFNGSNDKKKIFKSLKKYLLMFVISIPLT